MIKEVYEIRKSIYEIGKIGNYFHLLHTALYALTAYFSYKKI
jgi:hypothetical protein